MLLGQEGRVLWFTGLSGSGKSTIAQGVERDLYNEGYIVQVLDGDNIRTGLNNNLGFSLEDRQENIRRIAEAAKLFAQSGIICICSFVSPTIQIREMARQIIGPADFIEIFVDTPLDECERRDVKGLYAKARAGEIKGFTGIDSPYEVPVDPDINIKTLDNTEEESIQIVIEYLVKGKGLRVKANDDQLNEPSENYRSSSFEDLEIWQEGIRMVKNVYLYLENNKDWGFKDQIQRASISIPSNIAEGFERKSNREFIRYLYIAKGSCGELRTHLIVAKDLEYLEKEIANQLISRAGNLSKKIANFIKARSKFE